jgi:phosphatidylethanolamine/phosphatidyl-N-methylethanolamine N-methyltransferase
MSRLGPISDGSPEGGWDRWSQPATEAKAQDSTAPPESDATALDLRRFLRKCADTPLILWHYVSHPRRVGAVAPSSGWLARAMAWWVEVPPKGWVIELGAGTGAVTEALLARGVPPEQLLAIETMPRLVELLRRRFPHIRLVEGDARHLRSLIRSHLGEDTTVAAVVSSLPLRAFSRADRARVVSEIHALLPVGGRWIQFRYRLRYESALHWEGFRLKQSTVVWRNLPPARVVCYEKEGESARVSAAPGP